MDVSHNVPVITFDAVDEVVSLADLEQVALEDRGESHGSLIEESEDEEQSNTALNFLEIVDDQERTHSNKLSPSNTKRSRMESYAAIEAKIHSLEQKLEVRGKKYEGILLDLNLKFDNIMKMLQASS